MSGIRAELSFDDPSSCRVARLSSEFDAEARSVTWCRSPTTGRVTEEIAVVGDADFASLDLEPVFSYGSRTIYRFTRDPGRACPCEAVGSPVVDVHTQEGVLKLAVYLDDMDHLQSMLEDVARQFPDVDVDRVGRTFPREDASDVVLVDTGTLTARQREVIRVGHDMGYFDHPKGANAGEVAEELAAILGD
jgi:hypothetical protein